MKLNELRDTSYEIAKSKGWHDDDLKRSFADLMALVISEMAEALEEYRKQSPSIYFAAVPGSMMGVDVRGEVLSGTGSHKPEGLIVELADALIRIGDCAGANALSLGDTSDITIHGLVEPELKTGEPDSFSDFFCCITLMLASIGLKPDDTGARLTGATVLICRMAKFLGVTGEELERAIEIKHAYNRTRPHRHGGKIL